MVSINAKFRASKIEGKQGVVYFQLSYNKVVRQIKSDYRLFSDEWCCDGDFIVVDDSNSNRAKELRLIDEIIRFDTLRLYRLAKELESRGELNHCDDLVNIYTKQPKVQSCFNYFQSQISQTKEDGKLGTSNNYISAYNSFFRFRNGEDLVLDNLTSTLIDEYEVYLKSEKVSMNSISFYMRNMRAVYNKAVEQGVVEQQFPFKRVYTGVKTTTKQALTIDEIRQIRDYKHSYNLTCEFARDMFLFSFYTKGMSFIDIINLRKSDIKGGVLSYRKRKKGQPLYIKWEQCMQDIANKYHHEKSVYLFPIMDEIENKPNPQNSYKSESCKINSWLKRLSEDMHLDITLTMNVARHSWALAAKTKNIPTSIISESLGYANDTVTKIYLESLDITKVNEANSDILDDVL